MGFAVQAVATDGSITTTDVNLKTINSVTPSVNNGTADNGSQRVVIASDNTPFTINALQSGSWTVAATQSGTWNIGTLSTITNPVTVAQATAANLNATVVGTGTFLVQAAQSGTWTTGRTWTLASGTDSVAAVQSGTWNINNISGIISLPTGAATSTNQTNASQKTQIVDGSGNVISSTSNALNVNVNNTVPISGTVTANQGTSPWVSNITQFGSSNVVTGTGASGSGIPRVTVSNDSNILATQSGTWNIGTVTTITNPVTISNFPTTVDTNYGTVGASTLRSAAQIGNATGAALFGAGTTTAQVLRVVLPTDQTAIPVTQSGSWSVTANAGTNLNTSALALDATLAKLTLAQGSTTSGQTGALILGAVTTAAPSYTTAQSSPLSLDTSGNLRVAATVTFSSPQHVILDSGTLTSITNPVAVTQSGTWTTGRTWTLSSGTDSVAAVQSGTWNIGTLTSITNPVTVAQSTAANLNATVVGTGTFAVQAAQSGNWSTRTQDGSGNAITSTSNALDVNLKTSSITLPVSGTITANPPNDTAPATQNITVQDTGSTVTSGFNSQSIITGSPTANSTATFTLSSQETVRVQVMGTWTGTLAIEISMDGGTTYYINGGHQSGTSFTAASYTANFESAVNVGAATNFRVRATAAITGTATVKILSSVHENLFFLANPIKILDGAGGTSNTVNVTAANAMKVDGSAVIQPVTSNLSATSTGMTRFRNTALSNTAVAVKASAGNLYYYHVYNVNAADAYLQIYNVAQGSVTVGTTTPDLTLAIPAGGVLDGSFDSSPFSFATAITIAATTTITGGAAPSTGLLIALGYV